MVARSPDRHVAASVVVGVLALTLAACSGATTSPSAASPALDSSPTNRSPGASSDSAPAPTVGLLGDTTVDTLLAEATARDGQIVAVSGSFVADEGSAQLCVDLEVSPEQRCDGRIGLTGAVPAETLASLEFYRARNLWHGYVTVVGTFRASGADGQPTIEIDEIFLAP